MHMQHAAIGSLEAVHVHACILCCQVHTSQWLKHWNLSLSRSRLCLCDWGIECRLCMHYIDMLLPHALLCFTMRLLGLWFDASLCHHITVVTLVSIYVYKHNLRIWPTWALTQDITSVQKLLHWPLEMWYMGAYPGHYGIHIIIIVQ